MQKLQKKKLLFEILKSRTTWAVAALVSFLLYVTAWPLFFHGVVLPRAVQEKQGFRVELFDRPQIKGKPSASFLSRSETLSLDKGQTSLLAFALWKVSQGGRYLLHMECDDYGTLMLNGQDLIRLSGVSARNIGAVQVELGAGYHLLVLKLFNGPERGWLTLTSTFQGESRSLLGGKELHPVDLSRFGAWLSAVKGIEKGGWIFFLVSLALFFIFSFLQIGSEATPVVGERFSVEREATKVKDLRAIPSHAKVLVSLWILLMLLAFSNQIHLLFQLRRALPPLSWSMKCPDSISLFENQIIEIRPYLPSQGTIGFLSDGDDTIHLFRLQYALSPRLVTPEPGPRLIIGVFHDGASLRDRLKQGDLSLIKDFQNGLVLLERKNP